MSVSFSVKNIPDQVAEQLRLRAERNHRSLQGELMAILEAAAREATSAPSAPSSSALSRASEARRGRSVEDTLQNLRKLFPEAVQGAESSTRLIRQMRDGRFGDGWADTGEQRGPA